MKREQAIAIRTRQLQGERVDPLLLQQAIETIQETEVYYTDSQVNEMRRKLGLRNTEASPRVQKGAENLSVPQLATEDPDAAVVVEALAPWAIRKDD